MLVCVEYDVAMKHYTSIISKNFLEPSPTISTSGTVAIPSLSACLECWLLTSGRAGTMTVGTP